jgi:hypothetical protein
MMPPFEDIAGEPEDERIRLIGEKTMGEKIMVGFVVDAEEGKADRYIAKLRERFPGIRVMWKGEGPVADTVLVKVAPPVN